eukprot:m51a1_g8025 hypothetical protein (348) ;mRNA; f:13293-14452
MRAVLLAALLLLCHALGHGDGTLPWVEVDLADPPSYAAAISDALASYRAVGCTEACQRRLARALRLRWPEQYWEIVAAVAYINDVQHAVLRGPEPSHMGCTAGVTCGPDGRVLHSRNLDWSPTATYRSISAGVRWLDGGAPLYDSVDFLLDAATATGVRPGGVSVSFNWRGGPTRLDAVLRCIESPASLSPIRSALRRVLERGYEFGEALAYLALRPACAPVYLVLAGPERGQGVVVTKPGPGERPPEVPLRWVDCEAGEDEGDGWFAAQTNYDAWRAQPRRDDRLRLVSEALVAMGRGRAGTARGQWEAMSVNGTGGVRGVLNPTTCFSVVMSPADGVLRAGLRHS